MARLMEKETRMYSGNVTGMAYVKNSEGRTSNVIFHVISYINTADNSTDVKYLVKVFEPKQVDYFYQEYTVYSEAVDKYNELAIKWDGHREITKQ